MHPKQVINKGKKTRGNWETGLTLQPNKTGSEDAEPTMRAQKCQSPQNYTNGDHFSRHTDLNKFKTNRIGAWGAQLCVLSGEVSHVGVKRGLTGPWVGGKSRGMARTRLDRGRGDPVGFVQQLGVQEGGVRRA